ncbi:hypothetical protein BEWA_030720 [Theileria equi strain WA]|uniref:CERLI1-like PH domain-containing protein n=1 Tax=Theileria equi strain WA TaxID=1537102 RepID=L0AZ85_THEEQ|nr:hypothetical protein BEWA_030720 [Theileria equi strain WA]AFZ80219.1 hypothetical protein BEWA_030720 [Theileria equi strain WA]|eukprot:XP_004829885.1 hypothetical protein BEWA_030720 [Theileria equi strain WA]
MLLKLLGKSVRTVCCKSVEFCLYECTRRVTKAVPRPSEYEPIASLCYYSGIHNHREFQLLVNISDIEGDFLKRRTCIALEVGSHNTLATAIPISSTGVLNNIGSRASIRIRQCDNTIYIVIYKKNAVTKTQVCKLTFDIEKDIIDANFPIHKWYDLDNGNGKIGRIRLSFYKIATFQNITDCIVLQQAILCANEYANSGVDLKINIRNPDIMLEAEKIILFSFSLEGPIIAKKGYASQMLYFKAVHTNGAWYWNFWKSKEECRRNVKYEGSIPILSISTVLRHPTDYTFFYVRYYSKEGSHDLIFKSVDRSRDIWADSLYMFIENVRRYLEHFDNFDALKEHLT